jgi:hypothetical protein
MSFWPYTSNFALTQTQPANPRFNITTTNTAANWSYSALIQAKEEGQNTSLEKNQHPTLKGSTVSKGLGDLKSSNSKTTNTKRLPISIETSLVSDHICVDLFSPAQFSDIQLFHRASDSTPSSAGTLNSASTCSLEDLALYPTPVLTSPVAPPVQRHHQHHFVNPFVESPPFFGFEFGPPSTSHMSDNNIYGNGSMSQPSLGFSSDDQTATSTTATSFGTPDNNNGMHTYKVLNVSSF